ncbi:hypothetical protein B0H14DRAFT_3477831 [Mycena olivaceomarginata]|nr:hypothetical protein B0H14DRAFT_3477831 [Mycena olivaceomarginata]
MASALGILEDLENAVGDDEGLVDSMRSAAAVLTRTVDEQADAIAVTTSRLSDEVDDITRRAQEHTPAQCAPDPPTTSGPIVEDTSSSGIYTMEHHKAPNNCYRVLQSPRRPRQRCAWLCTGAAINPGARVAEDGAALEEAVVARDARGFVTDTPMGLEESILARDARGFVTSTPIDVGARVVDDDAGFEEPLLARDTRGFMAGAAIDPGARVADDDAGFEEPVVARDPRGFVAGGAAPSMREPVWCVSPSTACWSLSSPTNSQFPMAVFAGINGASPFFQLTAW